MIMIRSVILAVAGSAVLFAQTAPARAEFEVASIKPTTTAPLGAQVHVGVQIDGAQVHCTYLSVSNYIRIAYRVKGYQITGPDWLASDRFDIPAKLPAGAKREQVPEMLQTLLEERFQIKMHRDSKEFPVYGVVVGKGGLKLKESPLDPETQAGVTVTATGGARGTTLPFGRGAYFTLADNRFEARKLTMAQLADSLGRF